MRKAWEEYKGESSHAIDRAAVYKMHFDSKTRPENKKDFMDRIQNFLRTLKNPV